MIFFYLCINTKALLFLFSFLIKPAFFFLFFLISLFFPQFHPLFFLLVIEVVFFNRSNQLYHIETTLTQFNLKS